MAPVLDADVEVLSHRTASPHGDGALDTVQLLGDALEYPSHIASLSGAIGDRVTVQFQHAAAARIKLGFTPTGHLCKAVSAALQSVLPGDVWDGFRAAWLASPGAGCGDADVEWSVLSAVLLAWADDPEAFAHHGPHLPPATSGELFARLFFTSKCTIFSLMYYILLFDLSRLTFHRWSCANCSDLFGQPCERAG